MQIRQIRQVGQIRQIRQINKRKANWVMKQPRAVQPGETIEAQDWGRDRAFPGRIFIDEKGPAIETAGGYGHRNTI